MIVLVKDEKESTLSKSMEAEKKMLIDRIIKRAESVAFLNGKHFDYADLFFSLIFKSNKELLIIKEKIEA